MRTNYKDYVPTTELRKYNMINNADGTVSLRDVTTYEQEGDRLSAGVLNELSQNANWQLTHAKSSTTHTLTGLSGAAGTLSCVFTASADYMKGDTFTVDGESYTVKQQNGEEAGDKLFAAGAVVSCIIDTAGKTVNFKSGGGGKGGLTKYATGTVSTTTASSSAKCKGTITDLAFEPQVLVLVGKSNGVKGGTVILYNGTTSIFSLGAAGTYIEESDRGLEITFNGNSISFTATLVQSGTTPTVTYKVYG